MRVETEKDFSESNQVIQLGAAPLRIDILTSIKGMDFQDVRMNYPDYFPSTTVSVR
ncbi:MAG: hypothetical protein ACOC5S_05100 [Acidobacteriota bacterium]